MGLQLDGHTVDPGNAHAHVRNAGFAVAVRQYP